MSFHYKVMLLVVAVLSVTLWSLRPIFAPLMGPEQYRRRATTWLLLTLAAYLSPDILVYAVVGAAIIVVSGRKDGNPAGLYLMLLMAVPSARVPLPTFGIINNLFDLTHLRLLSLVLLMPLSFRLMRLAHVAKPGKVSVDLILISYLALQLVLGLPGSSATATLRNVIIMYFDVWLPYFVVSRALLDRELLTDALACLALAGLILAPLALLESASGWILYAVIPESWGSGIFSTYKMREGLLRAGLTAGNPIAMGYFFAIAFGAWLYVKSKIPSQGLATLGTAGLLCGLVFPLSKGPWLGAAVILIVFIALGPAPLGRLLRASSLVIAAAAIAMATPYGDRIIGNLPLVGTSGDSSFAYRDQLLQSSLLLLRQSPFFGVPNFLSNMENLRQGEGIIDLVNTYLIIALGYGGVALALFLAVFLAVLIKTFRLTRYHAGSDADIGLLGSSVIACIVGSLVMIGTVSPISVIPYSLWTLAGIGVAFCGLGGHDRRLNTAWEAGRPRAAHPNLP